MNFGAGDYGWMLLAVLVLFVPGGLVLAVAGWASRRRTAVGVATAPLVSVAVCYAAAVVTGLLGLSYGLVAVAVTTAAIAIAALAARRLRAGTVDDKTAHDKTVLGKVGWVERWRRTPWSLDVVGGLVLVVVALGISVRTWGRGLGGSLATVPQEHDMVTHTLLTAHIARSGEGAPWKVWTPDLLTGDPGGFYPSGFHTLAALVADAGADPVTAVNATMLVVLALCLPLGLLGLATLVERAQLRYLVGGVAGLVGAMAYRPTYALFHDGGILANAVAIALAPAALAGLLVLRERGSAPTERPTVSERSYWVDCCLIAAVAIGAFAVHPTSAAILGLSVAAWSVGELAYKLPRLLFWPRLLKLALGAVLMAVLALPLIRGGGSSVGTVAAWPRDVAVQSFPQALGVTLGMPYGGFLDFANARSQSLFAVLVLAGVAAVLVSRRGLALGVVWAVWSAVLLAFLAGAAVPGLATVTGVFYSSYVRISGVLGPFQWLMVGVAVTTAACLLVRAAERVVRDGSRAARVIRPRPGTAVVTALVLGLVLLAATGGTAPPTDRHSRVATHSQTSPGWTETIVRRSPGWWSACSPESG